MKDKIFEILWKRFFPNESKEAAELALQGVVHRIDQLYSAGEEVYVPCGKDAQTHYVVSTKAETDMAYIPVRKLTRPTDSAGEEVYARC